MQMYSLERQQHGSLVHPSCGQCKKKHKGVTLEKSTVRTWPPFIIVENGLDRLFTDFFINTEVKIGEVSYELVGILVRRVSSDTNFWAVIYYDGCFYGPVMNAAGVPSEGDLHYTALGPTLESLGYHYGKGMSFLYARRSN